MRKVLAYGCAISLACIFAVFLACGPTKSGGTGQITMNANMNQGVISPLGLNSFLGPQAGAAITPLSGYQLYCVTFTDPPVAGKGTADSTGAVSVTLSVGSASLGCFILDPAGKGVATVIFTDAPVTQSGQTVSVTGSVDLGTILVSLDSGVAEAVLPSGVALSATPAGTPCPVGTWTMGIPNTTCTTDHADFWIAQTTPGQYVFSYTHYGCNGTDSQSNLPMTYSGGVVTAAFNPSVGSSSGSYCPGELMTITFTPDGTCSTMSGSWVVSGVTQCGTNFGGCGYTTCPAVPGLSATKK